MINIRRIARTIAVTTTTSLLIAGNLMVHSASALNSSIVNPTLSQATNNLPTGWETDNWGNLTANFSYLAQGQDDSASVEVTVANYQDGDAKWYFDPVALTAGQQYTFADYYRSNQTTNVWAQLTDASGTVHYQWLGADAASTSWKQGSFALNVPAGIVSGTIFHVLAANGYLDTDNFSLALPPAQPLCAPSQASGIYNGSFAESCDNGATPAYWQKADYGTNTASMTYLTNGYDDNRSVQMAISSYTSGEAGWYFNPQSAASNQRYHFTAFLKGNTYSYAYVEAKLVDGSYKYLSLMSVPAPGSEWSLYDDAFVTPANTSTITIHFAISSVGSVQLDNMHLSAMSNLASNALTNPLVSINFDDGFSSAYTNALPVLNSLGIKATFYVNGDTIATKGYLTAAQLKTIATQGNEIGSHSYDHVDLVPLTQAGLNSQIASNQTSINGITGITPTTFATPYGSFNSRVLDTITASVPYVRDTDNAMNYRYNFNPRTIHAKDVTSTMTTADITALVKQAQQQGAWLVLVYHNVAASGDEYTVSKAKLQQQLQAIKKTGVSMVTNRQAINTILPQL